MFRSLLFQRVREWLTLVLLIVLPLHALLVTVLTKLVAGPGHAPLPQIALWKEGLLAVIFFIALTEIFLFSKGKLRTIFVLDEVDALILSLAIIGICATTAGHKNLPLFLVGFKYDFIPFFVFLILRRVQWSGAWKDRLHTLLVTVGVFVAALGIISFFLPLEVFISLGYSALHSLYLPDAPLQAFSQVSDLMLRRVQSTMSGPNQLGLWLLLPISIVLTCRKARCIDTRIRVLVLVVLLGALILTFSRAALLAAAFISVVAFFHSLPRKKAVVFSFVFLAILTVAAGATLALRPQILLRFASSRGHIVRPLQAVQIMREYPHGLGLGSAGPASNRVSDTCVELTKADDLSWTRAQPGLCVFVDGRQVQPTGRTCRCPFLPENWYLQIGVETGILGFALFLYFFVSIIVRLEKATRLSAGGGAVFLWFIGLAFAALFLHAYEDSAVAYSLWILTASVLPLRRA